MNALTKRLSLALRAQRRLNEQNIVPPATPDELCVDEYLVMLSQREDIKSSRLTKSEYQLEIGTTLAKPSTFPESKLFEL
ncbi:hypothetical protein [Acetobacter cibinongensis]|uniref:hypothetical protein n=1 Tax=Acetobacter cibinongensis TaxID=146475 RepID=UPI0010543BA9|nr:hypothetical protein [Acetobacter cibinongensis]